MCALRSTRTAAECDLPIGFALARQLGMDGYAVRFDDLKSDGEVTLAVTGTAFAGTPFRAQ